MQPSPIADTSKLLLPSLRICIGFSFEVTFAVDERSVLVSLTLRKFRLPAAPAFAYFAKVLAGFSEDNVLGCVQATMDYGSPGSQFLGMPSEFSVLRLGASQRGSQIREQTAHAFPSFSGNAICCLCSRSSRSFGRIENPGMATAGARVTVSPREM